MHKPTLRVEEHPMTRRKALSSSLKNLLGYGAVAAGGIIVGDLLLRNVSAQPIAYAQQISTATLSGDLGPNGSGQRTFNTVYRNTTGKTMLVSVSVSLVSLTGQGAAQADVLVDSTNPPTHTQATLQVGPAGVIVDILHGLGMVPAGYYYMLNNTVNPANSNYIQHWYEMTL